MTQDTQELIPALRPIEALRVRHSGREYLLLRDPQGVAPDPLLVPLAWAELLQFFDGRHSLRDVQLAVTRATGRIAGAAEVRTLVATLDQGLMLESEAYHRRRRELAEEYRAQPDRPARFAGQAYAADPEALRRELAALYTAGGAPGLPAAAAAEMPVAVAAPHIDPQRGASSYAHAYASLWGICPRRVILLGVNHAGSETPFILTTKDYTTPLGTLPTDVEFVQRLAGRMAWDPLSEQELHRSEHSLEFQVVLLQHALAAGTGQAPAAPPRIVPILCSFPWQVFAEREGLSVALAQVERFLAALRELAAEDPAGLLILAGVDLAHVGPRFGDPRGPSASEREELRRRDRATLGLLAGGDREGFIAETARERDARRICGFAALVSLMALVPGARGEVRDYGQSVEEGNGSVVSFAAVVFRPAHTA